MEIIINVGWMYPTLKQWVGISGEKWSLEEVKYHGLGDPALRSANKFANPAFDDI